MKDLFGNKLEKSAVFSPDRKFRYVLTRRWGPGKTCNFLMLNPSTADEKADDPTIRRCIDFAAREGAGSLVVTNLFALRATDPAILQRTQDPVGPDNDNHIADMANVCELVICAWGNHGAYLDRGNKIRALIRGLGSNAFCLGITAEHQPEHPLYIPKDRPLKELP